jgi:dihydroorotase
MQRLLYNAVIVNEGSSHKGYVVINDDKIAVVGEGDAPAELIASVDNAEDLEGNYLMPGVIDDQVHFRDPGLTHKADIATESAAAVAGGVTSFMDMPNTIPQTTTLEALEAKHQRAGEVSLANYSFFIGATNDNIDTLLNCDYSLIPGVKLFLGASTGNMLVDNNSALQRIFSEVPALIAIHSEDEGIIRQNKEKAQAQWGDDVPVEQHPLIRSTEACYQSTKKAVELATKYNARLHILHISTEAELEFLTSAPVEQKRVTAEVCAHHLWWSDEDYSRLGTRIKWNPAIKTAQDREALRQALADGRIDIVATDHAPHLLSEKEGGALKAASGGPLVQFSLLMMLELARKGVFSIEQVIDKMCHAPARLFNIEKRGFIREGYFADLAVAKPNEEYPISDKDVLSRCAWTPLAGETLHNKVISTYVNGN